MTSAENTASRIAKQLVLCFVFCILIGARVLAEQVSPSEQERLFLQRTIRHSPTDSVLRDFLGDYYFTQRAYKQAENAFRTAISLTPSDPYAWVELGRVHEALGKPDEALQDFKESLRLASYPIQFQIARAYHQLGNERKALEILRQLNTTKDSAEIHYAMALSQAGLARYKEAVQELDLGAKLDPRLKSAKIFFADQDGIDLQKMEWKEREKERLLKRIFAVLVGLTAFGLWKWRKILFSGFITLEIEEEF